MKGIGSILLMIALLIVMSCGVDVNDDHAVEENTTTPQSEVVIENQTESPENSKVNYDEYVYKHRSTLESGNDREKYIWEVLRLSLEATKEDYGSYQIVEVENINQIREDVELIHDTGLITVMSDSLNEANLSQLNHIQFPLLRNLLGYRVFMIKAGRQDEFYQIGDSETLKNYSFGVAYGWNDKIILEHSGYSVYEEAKYESLFRSLMEENFDIFSRGVNEVIGEIETYKDEYPELHVEESILLYYPLPRYFWFSKTDEGDLLRLRVEVGLQRIIEDGSFYELFNAYFSDALNELNLEDRLLIEMENPMYGAEFDELDKVYRFNPFILD